MSDRLKSAVELAMEKYGGGSRGDTTLTEEQKERIADTRSFYKAKRAELEILHKQHLMELQLAAPEEQFELRNKAGEEYQRDRSRLDREEEQKIDDIRNTKSS